MTTISGLWCPCALVVAVAALLAVQGAESLVTSLDGAMNAGTPFPHTYNTSGKGWKFYCEGNCDPFRFFVGSIEDTTTMTAAEAAERTVVSLTKNDEVVGEIPETGCVLMGGGLDDAAAFAQQAAWSRNGNFVVLRADDDAMYNNWIYSDIGGVSSVSTIVVMASEGAASPFVHSVLRNASAIFIAGGDQWTYYHDWHNTPIADILFSVASQRTVPIGGTSAGCMVLSPFVYDAEFNSVTSDEALKNPMDHRITLTPGFVNVTVLPNVSVIDTHFFQRNRFGRLLVFVARLLYHASQLADHPDRKELGAVSPVYGIGISQHSACTVNYTTGIGMLHGNPCSGSDSSIGSSDSGSSSSAAGGNAICGTAYIIYGNQPVSIEKDTPLTMEPVLVQKLVAGDTFDFFRMEGGQQSNRYRVGATNGVLTKADPFNP